MLPFFLSLFLAAPVIQVDHGPNAPAQQAKPYVVLVSLDGFRYDYAHKYGAKHLQALAAMGAIADQGMIPSYPSLTFPNHYTLVTGLYPEHHGIVANSFYDPARKQRYTNSDPATTSDGSWYGGIPLWVLAEKQSMRSACFFWPGSEAEIAGARPTYYLKFNDHFPDGQRIDQVVAWLSLPAEQRPHFITLYYSNVDHAGHQYGPDSPETAAAVQHVDQLVGDLWTQLTRLHLPIDLVVVSDHGMEREQGPWIDLETNLDQFTDLANFTTVGSLLYADSEAAAEKAYQGFKIKSDAFTVYRRARVPAALHYNANPREGDPVIVANGPYAIRAHGSDGRPPDMGVHGYDPRAMKTMRALFIAVGPDIVPGSTLEPFENVNVYPFIAKILGLDPPDVDGNINVLAKILR